MKGIRLLIVGSEVTNGFTLDKNTNFFARELYKNGFTVLESRIIRDNVSSILNALSDYSLTGDFIIMSGGLGPTDDDLAVDVLAEFTGSRAVIHEASEHRVRDFFAKRASHTRTSAGFSLDRALRQARIVEGCEVLHNPVGLAPAMFFPSIPLVSLPGFPREIEGIWPQVLQAIEQSMAEKTETTEVSLWAISESGLSASMQVPSELEFGVHALPFGTRLFLRASNNDRSILHSFGQSILDRFPGHTAENPLLEFIEYLKKTGRTMTTAESCTGGLGAKLLTDIPGVSAVYPGSIVAYANSVKENLLGVSAATLDTFGAVSHQTAKEMALGALSVTGGQISISITGIAGPDGGSDEKPVGTVYIGIADSREEHAMAGKFFFPFGRDIFRNASIHTAFLALYQKYVYYNGNLDSWLHSDFGKNFTFQE